MYNNSFKETIESNTDLNQSRVIIIIIMFPNLNNVVLKKYNLQEHLSTPGNLLSINFIKVHIIILFLWNLL